MDTLSKIVDEFNNEEYEVLLETGDPDDWLLTPIKVKRPGLQLLINKFGTSLKCRELGQKKWTTASAMGFKVSYQRKNVAISKRRLQENNCNSKLNNDADGMFFGIDIS